VVHTGFLDAQIAELADSGDVPAAAIAVAAVGSTSRPDARRADGDASPDADPWTTLGAWGR
jgi:hypothetical protein